MAVSEAGCDREERLLRDTPLLERLYISSKFVRPPGSASAYILASVIIAAATAIRIAVDSYVTGMQFIFLSFGIMIATFVCGVRAGGFHASWPFWRLGFLYCRSDSRSASRILRRSTTLFRLPSSLPLMSRSSRCSVRRWRIRSICEHSIWRSSTPTQMPSSSPTPQAGSCGLMSAR
jgi:hypothetical protein